MKSILFGLTVFCAFFNAEAGLLTLTPDTKKIETVTLSTTAEATPYVMMNVASGLRKKYVAIFGTPVYVVQFFATQPEVIVKTAEGNQMLASFADQEAVAVRLDFVYSVSADQVYTAFTDSLKENAVNTNKPATAEFLAAVKNGGDAPKGTSMNFLMTKNADNTETLVYEDPKGATKTIEGAGLTKEILSMWLGKISANDKGLKELKAQLAK